MDRDAFVLNRRVVLRPARKANFDAQLEKVKTNLNLDAVIVRKNGLRIVYSAAEMQWPSIEDELKKLNCLAEKSFRNNIRFRWYRFVDDNAKTNAHSKEAHCCNKPPVILKK